MYNVRRVNIGKTKQLDELAHACGELYSKTVVFFWRTVRHKGIWLKCAQMERLFTRIRCMLIPPIKLNGWG
jgi:putative transposase